MSHDDSAMYEKSLKKMAAMVRREYKASGVRDFCMSCEKELKECGCIWASIRDLQSKVEQYEHWGSVCQLEIEKRISNLEISVDEMLLSKCKMLEDRIEILEKENDMRRNTIGCIDSAYNDAFLEIEKWKRSIDKTINMITEDDMKAGKKPYKCPVCDGTGNIYKGCFHSAQDRFFGWKVDQAGMAYKECESCEGKRIVWG